MFTNKRSLWIFAFILLLIDQAIKFLIYEIKPQIITYNRGIFFGWIDNRYSLYIFLILGIIVLFFLFVKSSKQYMLPLTVIAVGALSNIIDRIFYPGVIDYINFSFWSSFNLSDIYIFVGALWYLQIMLTHKD